MTEKVIRAEEVSQEIRRQRMPALHILEDVSLEVARGEVFGLLGLEGAGKTSLVKILTGLREPTAGRAEVLGADTRSLSRVRYRVGFVSESKGLYDFMKVKEIVLFCKKLSTHWDEEKVWRCLKSVYISPLVKVGALSRSQRSFLYLALTLGMKPEVLMLDEPLEAFDDVGKELFSKLLLDYMEGADRAVFIASKNILDIAGIVDRVAILRGGKLAYCGAPGEMQEKFCKIRIVPRGAADFQEIPGVYSVEQENRSYLIKIRDEKLKTIEMLRQIPNDFFDVIPMSIRDTYLELAKEGNTRV